MVVLEKIKLIQYWQLTMVKLGFSQGKLILDQFAPPAIAFQISFHILHRFELVGGIVLDLSVDRNH